MPKLTLTGVNFNFADGVHNPFTSVNLVFNSSGGTFTIHGFVQVTVEEYQAAMLDPDKLADLVKSKVLADLQQ
jgi:hypothetical protein